MEIDRVLLEIEDSITKLNRFWSEMQALKTEVVIARTKLVNALQRLEETKGLLPAKASPTRPQM